MPLIIKVALSPGMCRWCGCTYNNPCAAGCGWADRAQTLCTACVPLDMAIRSVKGRQQLADFLQEVLASEVAARELNRKRRRRGKTDARRRGKKASA